MSKENNSLVYEKEPCPNCGETRIHCACMRNICIDCGNPVGNITFSRCDKCWDINKLKKEHAEMLNKLVECVDFLASIGKRTCNAGIMIMASDVSSCVKRIKNNDKTNQDD